MSYKSMFGEPLPQKPVETSKYKNTIFLVREFLGAAKEAGAIESFEETAEVKGLGQLIHKFAVREIGYQLRRKNGSLLSGEDHHKQLTKEGKIADFNDHKPWDSGLTVTQTSEEDVGVKLNTRAGRGDKARANLGIDSKSGNDNSILSIQRDNPEQEIEPYFQKVAGFLELSKTRSEKKTKQIEEILSTRDDWERVERVSSRLPRKRFG